LATKRGLGSIDKLASGKYRVRYTDPLGIRRSARTTFKTKASAEFELTRIREAIENGTWLVDQAPQAGGLEPKTLTLKELADHWRAQRVSTKGKSLSVNTLNEYQRLIEKVLVSFAAKPIRSITTAQIEDWRVPEFNRAPNQAVKAYKHLRTLMTYAHKRHWIATNPCDIERATAYTSKEPPAPTSKQVQIMIENAREPFKTILIFACYGGLRRGEILELRRKDISIIKEDGLKWVRVNITRAVVWDKSNDNKAIVEEPKTESGIRSLLMPLEAGDHVIEYLKSLKSIDPDVLLLENPVGSNIHWGEYKINPHWRRVRALAGFSGRFHSLRAYASTEFAKLNPTDRELMERFGHRNITTAQKYQRTTGRESQLLRGMNNVG
jgi:integrase